MTDAQANQRELGSASGAGALILAAFLFSWGFIFVKAVALPTATTGFWRLAIGAVTLAGVALIRRTPWPRCFAPVLGAGICFGFHQLLYVRASQTTSIAIVTLVGALQPLLVAMVSRRLIGERVPRAMLFWSVISVLSVCLVVYANLNDRSRSLEGDLLSLVNLVVFTAYFLFTKRARELGAPTLTLTASVAAIALVVVLPMWLASEPRVAEAGWQWLLLIVLALGPGNGHLLMNWAHRRVSAAFSSLTLSLVPLLASAWAYWLFQEPYAWTHAAGMLLAACAVEGARRVERGSRAANTPARA